MNRLLRILLICFAIFNPYLSISVKRHHLSREVQLLLKYSIEVSSVNNWSANCRMIEGKSKKMSAVGFEPATLSSGGTRDIQLRYAPRFPVCE